MFRRRRKGAQDESKARDEVEEHVASLDPDLPEAKSARLDGLDHDDPDSDDYDDRPVRRRGRRRAPDPVDEFDDEGANLAAGDRADDLAEDEFADEDDEPAGPRSGPWDAEDAPEDEVARVDLGALQVPTLTDVEVRVEADQQGQVSAVLLVHGQSAVQLGAFAAPRTEGIWDEVREEIGEGIRSDGGRTEDRDGEFGIELLARVSTPEGTQHLRFVGVDGPRWFLRAVYTGRAAVDPAMDKALAESVRQLVVVRGNEPMPVRDPLPLHIPQEVVEEHAEEGVEPDRAVLPPRRGPEITEIR